MKAINLKCEYLDNPIGIDIIHPRITWNDEGIEFQDSFEIIYSINGINHYSGRIYSSAMNYIFKDKFVSRDRVEYQVIIYDKNNNKSEISDKAFFEFGLLQKEEFLGKWISGDYQVNKNKRYPVDYFLKEFSITRVTKARLYISACGLYEARINNQKVDDSVFNPGFTDYRKRIQYQSFDVTSLLQQGNNQLTIELADGWYRGSIGAKGRRNTYGKQTKIFFQLEVYDGQSVKYIISDDNTKWSNDGPIRFADLKDGEIINNNMQPSYAKKAKEVKGENNFCASNNVLVKEHEHFIPAKMFLSKTNKYIYEFPQNLAGYVSLIINANKNQILNIVMGEMLDENDDVSLNNIQCTYKKKKTPLQHIQIICQEGINEYKSKYYFGGFRYVSADQEIEEIEAIAVYSDFREASKFVCSNDLINQFYKNTIWSLKSNSIDIPTDCPTRERMGWTGDSQIFFNTASYLVDYASFARKHVRDIFDRQFKDGKLAHIVPFSNEDWYMNPMNGSVGWADAGVLIPYRFYLKYGDKRILEDNYESMVKYAKFMISRCGKAKGIYKIYAKPLHLSKENVKYQINTGQSYGEWAEPNDIRPFIWLDFAAPHPEESMAYTTYIMKIMIEISNIIDRKENNQLFAEYENGIKKAYQQLVSKEEHSLDTNRQAKLVRPLYMNLLTFEEEEFAKKRLIKALDDYGWRLGTGFLSTPFILDVLCSIDKEYAYKLLLNTKMPGWLYMSINNTGTIWEGWEGLDSDKGIASLNHYCKGAMVEWLFKSMAGINVIKENEFEIKPILDKRVNKVYASYDSIYGKIECQFIVNDNDVDCTINVPGNCSAVFAGKILHSGVHKMKMEI